MQTIQLVAKGLTFRWDEQSEVEVSDGYAVVVTYRIVDTTRRGFVSSVGEYIGDRRRNR